MSATAKRGEMHLICVIMGAETRDERNAMASKLLDYGFANYSCFKAQGQKLDEIKVVGGIEDTCGISFDNFTAVVNKGDENKITSTLELNDNLVAPVKIGDVAGKIVYKNGDITVGEIEIKATENIEKIKFGDVLKRIFIKLSLK